jgi:hypothetical protein
MWPDISSSSVIPAKAGIHVGHRDVEKWDSGFRRNDDKKAAGGILKCDSLPRKGKGVLVHDVASSACAGLSWRAAASTRET